MTQWVRNKKKQEKTGHNMKKFVPKSYHNNKFWKQNKVEGRLLGKLIFGYQNYFIIKENFALTLYILATLVVSFHGFDLEWYFLEIQQKMY